MKKFDFGFSPSPDQKPILQHTCPAHPESQSYNTLDLLTPKVNPTQTESQ